MSSYPPPPPPIGAPQFGRADWKAQRRAMQAQQKAIAANQRAAYKLQRAQFRARRRGSLVGPLLLIALGVIFLLTQSGFLAWSRAFAWYGRWWPAVLIAAGILLIAEWLWARQREEAGQPVTGPVLGGGVIFLLILLASVGWSMRWTDSHYGFQDHFMNANWSRMMGDPHESDSTLSSAITPGAPLVIRCPHGDVTVTGSSADGQVHVSAHKQVYAWQDSEADRKEQQIEPRFSSLGTALQLDVPAQDGSQADLTIEVPRDIPVTVEATRGNVAVNELHAPVQITAVHGDVDMSGITGAVTVHVNHDNASISGHSVNGSISVEGHSGDMNFTDVEGPVNLHGEFFGTTHLERINGQVRFQTSRTQFQAERLDGEFEVDTGADLQADQLVGPVLLTTRNRNIELDRVAGHVQITNKNGSVTVTQTNPFAGIQVKNDRGSVDVGIPAGAAFVVDAQTRHGDIDANDFPLTKAGSDEAPVLKGTIGTGGPLVSLNTTNGDVTVRKTSVLQLSSAPPVARKVTITPGASGVPKPPAIKAPKAPVAPKAPKLSAAPAVVPAAPAAPAK